MNYFVVEGFCDWGDYRFTVCVDTQEEVQGALDTYFDGPAPKGFAIGGIYGPFDMSKGDVIVGKQPE